MEKTFSELKQELEALKIELRLASRREAWAAYKLKQQDGPVGQIPTAVWSERVPAAVRRRVHRALADLPGPGGWEAAGYRERVFAAIGRVARAWGGRCTSAAYNGHKVPLRFECDAGHSFSMPMHMLRVGHWCKTCACERATIHSLEEARELAARRGGQCLSKHYQNTREKLQWRCAAGHVWFANLEGVLKGDWCWTCHFERIKLGHADIEAVAHKRGGRCLSAYVDKETPLEWLCSEGHIWSTPWCRVSKGQWCHRCAVKARIRTISDLQEVAQSRGGRCLPTAYLGVHEKHEWECMDRHVWYASANSVLRGSWCPECAWASRRMARQRKQNRGKVPILV